MKSEKKRSVDNARGNRVSNGRFGQERFGKGERKKVVLRIDRASERLNHRRIDQYSDTN